VPLVALACAAWARVPHTACSLRATAPTGRAADGRRPPDARERGIASATTALTARRTVWTGRAPASTRLQPYVGLLPESLLRHILEFVPPSCQVAASAGRDAVLLWRFHAAGPVRTLRGHTMPVLDIKFFPQGDRLVTTGADGRAIVWSTTSGRALHVFERPAGIVQIYDVQVFPDGERLVTVSGDFSAVVWNASSGRLLHRLVQTAFPERSHRAARVFPKGDRIVTGASGTVGGGAIIWDTTTGKVRHSLLQPSDRPCFLELSPDGGRVFTVGDHAAWAWDANSGVVEQELVGHGALLTGVAVAGSKLMMVSGHDGRVTVWDLGGRWQQTVETSSAVLGVAAIPGKDRAVYFTNTSVVTWSTVSGQRLRKLAGRAAIQRIAVSPVGNVMAACGDDHGSGEGSPSWRLSVWDSFRLFRVDIFSASSVNAIGGAPCSVAVGVDRRAFRA